jgi:very-short-patch-repair endonuclease
VGGAPFRRALRAIRAADPEHEHLGRGHEVDPYWADVRLAVELDGAETHLTHAAFEEDRKRDRELAVAGVQVARATRADLADSERLAAELRAIRQGRRRARSR